MRILDELAQFHNLLLRLRETSSLKVKQAELTKTLKLFPAIDAYLRAAFNPWDQYHLTSATVMRKFKPDVTAAVARPVLATLYRLSTRQLSGNAAGQEWANILHCHAEYADTLNCVLDKDIKCRIGVDTVNKCLKEAGLDPIPTFEVALGEPYEDQPVWEEEVRWYASRKLDGIRCVAIVPEGGPVQLYSRTGQIFTTLASLTAALGLIPPGVRDIVLDGELALVNETGEDDFQGMMKQIHRKDHDIRNVRFHAFDCVTLSEFKARKSAKPFRERCTVLWDYVSRLQYQTPMIDMVEQVRVKTPEQFKQARKDAEARGWEGLILRADRPYIGKRSRDILKVKTFYDVECVVKAIEVGPFAVVENKREASIETMTAVVVDYKGHEVSVGSGFTLEQRKAFHRDESLIVGKVITVKYFEETRNQQGGISLRFPTCKTIHGDTRTT